MENEKYFIGFDCKKIEKATVLELVNNCELINGVVVYINKHGEVRIPLNEFNQQSYTTLIKKADVDVKDSLYYWFKQNNTNQTYYNLDFILDETIDNSNKEKPINYTRQCWNYTIVMKVYDDCVKYNII